MKCSDRRTRNFNLFKRRKRFAANEAPACDACNDYGYVRRDTWSLDGGKGWSACDAGK